jgi:hemoglobin-like flavoprotein
MNTRQIILIRSSFQSAQLAPVSVANLFYTQLFKADPALQQLFKGDMEAQYQKLMSTLNVVVNSLEDLNPVIPAVQQLGQRHAAYGVKNQDYDLAGAVLMQAFRQTLGSEFTDETEDAWQAAYTLLTDVKKEAAQPAGTA